MKFTATSGIQACIPLLLLLALTISCQKELAYEVPMPHKVNDFYVKFKADGKTIEYIGFTKAAFYNVVPGMYSLSMQGQQSDSATQNYMAIILNSDVALTNNVEYTDQPVNTTLQATLVYNDATGNQFTSALNRAANVKVSIDEITAAYVTGTFSGDVENVNRPATSNPSIIKITDGLFKVKRN